MRRRRQLAGMDRRWCFGFLAGFLLISAAVGVRDAAVAGGRLRVLMAEKEGERSDSGQVGGSSFVWLFLVSFFVLNREFEGSALVQEAGSHSATDTPVGGSRSSPSSVPKNSPPPGNSSDAPPASRAPPNPPAAQQKASPLTPVSGDLSNPAPAADNSTVPVSGSPSHPPPASSGLVNSPPSSSGSPLNRSPPGNPSRTSPASDGRFSPPPVSGNRPPPAEPKSPNPVPSQHGREPPNSGKDEKEKEKKKETDSSSKPDGSQGKGQETNTCNASMPRCHDGGLDACLQQSQNEPKKWILLVQNEGKSPLKVNISAPSSVKIDKTMPLQSKRSKIEFHVDAVEGQRIVLNAGNGDCTLQMLQPSSFAGNIFQQFPNYANHVTPIYGVYLASLTVIFAGGTWACCKFRKRRRVDAGVAYQQLEMGTQQQSSAPFDEDELNGWDEGWNDDWDEEAAAPRPPEKRASASENGVTFRSSDKNEWEDWDD